MSALSGTNPAAALQAAGLGDSSRSLDGKHVKVLLFDAAPADVEKAIDAGLEVLRDLGFTKAVDGLTKSELDEHADYRTRVARAPQDQQAPGDEVGRPGDLSRAIRDFLVPFASTAIEEGFSFDFAKWEEQNPGLLKPGELRRLVRAHQQRNRHGLVARLRENVDISRVDLPEKALVTQTTTNANAAEQLENIDTVLEKFPNATKSPTSWRRMMAYALASGNVPMAPKRMIRLLQNKGAGMVELLRRLTPGQIKDAQHRFDNGKQFFGLYTSGLEADGKKHRATAETTGKLLLWSFLSRGVSPYAQESLFVDAAPLVDIFIKKAAAGDFTAADLADYERAAERAAPKGSGQPGAGATHNLNAYGGSFLLRMSEPAPQDPTRTKLQYIHDLLSDKEVTGKQLRREFAQLSEGVGIDNKVLAFTALVTGRTDVLILDRVQMRNTFDDGQLPEGYNLYDGETYPEDHPSKGKPIPGTGLAPLTMGARGILLYEALERGINDVINDVYAELGRPEDASIGRWHWESWVAYSGQEASHKTLDAILAEATGKPQPYANVGAKEGEYGAAQYGAEYARAADGAPYFRYTTPAGKTYEFSVRAFRQFIARITKAKPSGMLFSKDEAGNDRTAPWFNDPRYDTATIEDAAAEFGRPNFSRRQPTENTDETSPPQSGLFSGRDKNGWRQTEDGRLIGYRVDNADRGLDGGVSNIFVSREPDYVKTYYGGISDTEEMLEIAFDPLETGFLKRSRSTH